MRQLRKEKIEEATKNNNPHEVKLWTNAKTEPSKTLLSEQEKINIKNYYLLRRATRNADVTQERV